MTDLETLARVYRVQTRHFDGIGRYRQVAPEVLLHVLRALGAPVDDVEHGTDLRAALREARQARWSRLVEPVVACWEGEPARVELHSSDTDAGLEVTIGLETGESRHLHLSLGDLPTRRAVTIDGRQFVRKTLEIPGELPAGYHRLTFEREGALESSLLISAPRRAFSFPDEFTWLTRLTRRAWGVFLPLYALHSQRSWGVGDFTDLEALVEWQAAQGGRIASTLPFLATFLDEPCDPSPYGPASRLFWNELYIDPTRAPELQTSTEAQEILSSPALDEELSRLRASRLVDYRSTMAVKKRVLASLSRHFFERRASARREAFERFSSSHPRLFDYARFRAFGDQSRTPWPEWPSPARNGVLEAATVDSDRTNYHAYVQWLAHEQVSALATKAAQAESALYLDLPLGAQLWSYDVWRERETFVLDAALGAPPDGFFIRGQNWGLPPLHPEASRRQGHRYFVECVRHQLRHAGVLRIDHVMGLDRLYFVPRGLDAESGAYVHYPADELYAILCLESQRHRSAIVGENLGTVPGYVNRRMEARGFLKMHVLQFDVRANPEAPFGPVPEEVVASLNTHDTPTFEGFRRGADVDDRVELGLLDAAKAEKERAWRHAVDRALEAAAGSTGRSPVRAALAHLARSAACLVLVNLEDLWGEIDPQNVPGIVDSRPNWRRKARFSFEAFCQMPEVVETIRTVHDARSKGGNRIG